MLLTRLLVSVKLLLETAVDLVMAEYRECRDREAADSLDVPRVRRIRLPSRVDRTVPSLPRVGRDAVE